MEVPLEIVGCESLDLKVKSSGFLSGPKLLSNGQAVKPEKGGFQFQDSTGNTIEIKLKPMFFDGMPKVEINGETHSIAEPLKWYEYLIVGLPLVLVLVGGMIGGIIASFLVMLNSVLIRSDMHIIHKFGTSAVLTFGAGILCTIIATIMRFTSNAH